MSNIDVPVICIMWCLVNWGPKSNHLFIKKNCLQQLIPKMIFYWKKIVNKLKTLFAFELWTVHQFQGLASFSKWTVSVLLASLCLWYSCFCLFIMVTFLAPLRYVQLLQHLLSETWGGDWVGCWTVFCPYCGREARTVLHAIWPAFKISSGNFCFS